MMCVRSYSIVKGRNLTETHVRVKKAHTTEMVPKSNLCLVFANARAVSDRLTWFLHLLLCHRPCEPFPLSSSSQHRI